MRRRDALSAALAAGVTWCFRSARGDVPLLGFLHGSAPTGPYPGYVARFVSGLHEQGFDTPRNVAVEYRWAEGSYDRMAPLAGELLARHPATMVVYGPPNAVRSAIDAIPKNMPVVFGTGGDPLAAGIVPSLARPSGNVTGVANRTNALDTKRLELLHDLLPGIATVGLILNTKNSDALTVKENLQSGARTHSLRLVIAAASTPEELEDAFRQVANQGAGAVLVASDAYFNAESARIVGLAAQHRLPAIYNGRPFTDAGGLISYGADFGENYRLIGVIVGKILNGAKPADIPVVEPARFELVINLKTAKALGLTVPQLLLAQANEVIE